jgi:hypothetical protein
MGGGSVQCFSVSDGVQYGGALRGRAVTDRIEGEIDMGNITTADRPPPVAVLRITLLVLVALVTLKFTVLLAEVGWRLSQAPLPLLIIVAVPGVALAVLARRRPRIVAAVALPIMVVFVGVVVAALVRDGLMRESWVDYPFAYGGLIAALVGAAAAVALLRGDDRQSKR